MTARELEVHQFVPALLPYDAVGNHTLRAHRDLVAQGAAATIWAKAIHTDLAGEARQWDGYDQARPVPGRHRAIVYQAASNSGGMLDRLVARPEPIVLSYHNVTPPEFLAPYDGGASRELQSALKELRRLAERMPVAVAASEFNAIELREMGMGCVRVIPPYLGTGFTGEPDRETVAKLKATKRGIDVLFVGRLSPNKGHAHLLRLTAALRKGIDPDARLLLVGGEGPPLYMRWLEGLIGREVPEAVVMAGSVSEAELAAYYAHADVFVCLSDHEGFGVPLVEAMRAGMPVLAYDAGAVGETLRGAGVLVRSREPALLAELVARLAGDEALRDEVVTHQRGRAAEIEAFPRAEALVAAVAGALEAR